MKNKNIITAPISEIFFSWQGEGIYLGEPQIFVRFAGCNLRCFYCDTPGTQTVTGRHAFLSTAQVLSRVKQAYRTNKKHFKGIKKPSVSLTGGEPVLHAAFLAELMAQLRREGFKTYLETNGTLFEEMRLLSPLADVIAMDIKLPSASGKALWNEHRKFLEAAKDKAFVKVVLTSRTKTPEVRRALKLIESISPEIPLVFQPSAEPHPPKKRSIQRFNQWLSHAVTHLSQVHVIPQMHKFWNVR